MRKALENGGLRPSDLAAIGITNQRETTLIWDKATGKPLHNALVWQDTRNDRLVAEFARDGGGDRFRDLTGLPLASYFSGLKLRWLLDHVDGAKAKAEAGAVLFGNIDTWLVWNLTGGPDGGLHLTDVTNASRTQLMALKTLDWDEGMLAAFGIPRAMLPKIVSSSAVYGETRAPFPGVPIAGILGDQQAALFGQTCFRPGEAKNTYGTGCFALMNTGEELVPSKAGLVTTLAYRLDGQKPVYALEGSIAITGALVQWLRDNLHMIKDSAEVESLATTVSDNGGVYFVPAFSGLYAPHWERGRARADHRADALRQPRPHRPLGAGGHRLPDQGGAEGDGSRFRHPGEGAAHRWRHGRQRDSDAVPGRHPRRAGGAPEGDRDHGTWVQPTRPASRSATGTASTTCLGTGASIIAGSRRWRRPSARRSPRRGAGR